MKSEVIEKMAILITTAFGLVAALAWNDAIKQLFAQLFGAVDSLIPLFTYAIVVTIIAVFATIWIGKLSEKTKK